MPACLCSLHCKIRKDIHVDLFYILFKWQMSHDHNRQQQITPYQSISLSLATLNLCLSESRFRVAAFISSSRTETLAHASSRAACKQQEQIFSASNKETSPPKVREKKKRGLKKREEENNIEEERKRIN